MDVLKDIINLASSWSDQFPSLHQLPDFLITYSSASSDISSALYNSDIAPKTITELIELHQHLTTLILEHQTDHLASGNFQTSDTLVDAIYTFMEREQMLPDLRSPQSIIDPTCGSGIFLLGYLHHMQQTRVSSTGELWLIGIDRNRELLGLAWLSLNIAKDLLISKSSFNIRITLYHRDLLELITTGDIATISSIDLVVGNPPWVAWSDLSSTDRDLWKELDSKTSYDFITAKGIQRSMGGSNIDIGPLLFILILQLLSHSTTCFSFLFKPDLINSPSLYWFRQHRFPSTSQLSPVLSDVVKFPQNAVESSHFINLDMASDCFIGRVNLSSEVTASALINIHTFSFQDYWIYRSSEEIYPISVQSPSDTLYLPEIDDTSMLRTSSLPQSGNNSVEIRHGIKHDSRDVYEITPDFAESLGWQAIYPTIKSRHVQSDGWDGNYDLVIVPHRSLKDIDEERFSSTYPRTYKYLLNHKAELLTRKSRWIRDDTFYAIFGIGEYSFATYKVAWVRLGWKPYFVLIEPVTLPNGEKKPVIPSDHYMFIPTENKTYAKYLINLLNSPPYQIIMSHLSSKKKSSLPKKLVNRLVIPTEEEFTNLQST